MSDILGEEVFPMPPLSLADCEVLADNALIELAPLNRLEPRPLDIIQLTEAVLPQMGIHMGSASLEELGARLAATRLGEEGQEVEILLEERLFDQLYAGGRMANRARATIIHELPHAIVHMPVMRRRLALPHNGLLFARLERRNIPAYRDPEWQAWAIGGYLAAPRSVLDQFMPGTSVAEMADTLGVSQAFLQAHLRRINKP